MLADVSKHNSAVIPVSTTSLQDIVVKILNVSVEAACVSLRCVWELWHLDTICLTLCLFFFSGGQVAKLYRDASLGNVVNIIVTRLIVLTEDQVREITLNPAHSLSVGVWPFWLFLERQPFTHQWQYWPGISRLYCNFFDKTHCIYICKCVRPS